MLTPSPVKTGPSPTTNQGKGGSEEGSQGGGSSREPGLTEVVTPRPTSDVMMTRKILLKPEASAATITTTTRSTSARTST